MRWRQALARGVGANAAQAVLVSGVAHAIDDDTLAIGERIIRFEGWTLRSSAKTASGRGRADRAGRL